MTLVYLGLVALVCLIGGFVAGRLLERRAEPPRPLDDDRRSPTPKELPYSSSIDDLARALDDSLRAGAALRVMAVYAGRDGSGALEARWRDADERPGLPLVAPESLVVQLGRSKLVDSEEIERGLHPGLPPGDPRVVASQVEAERIVDERRAADALEENPFELDDEALAHSAMPTRAHSGGLVAPRIDAAKLAARLAAIPWRGPFGWVGLIVARPSGDPRKLDLASVDRFAETAGDRLGVHCEVTAAAPVAPPEDAAPPEVARTIVVAGPSSIDEDPSEARVRRADARLAEVLQAPRREPDLVRATVGLLMDGLAPDRCYAVEIEGLHTKPIEQERRSEAAAPATGLDFGTGFLSMLSPLASPTIRAVTLDADEAAMMVPEDAREQLGPVSRMLLPVLEKGRIVIVFVAEWIDRTKRWNPNDVAFAERVAARAAAARERLLQFEALAEQAGHERAEKEQIERAFEQLQSLLAAVPDSLVGLDGDGAITFANRAASRLFGKMEFELMGRWIGEAAANLGGESGMWESALTASTLTRYPSALHMEGKSLDVAVVPVFESSMCSRLVTFASSDVHATAPRADSTESHESLDVARDIVEPIGRLLGSLDLLAGGTYGDLTPAQEESLAGALRIGTELRARLNDVMRSKA